MRIGWRGYRAAKGGRLVACTWTSHIRSPHQRTPQNQTPRPAIVRPGDIQRIDSPPHCGARSIQNHGLQLPERDPLAYVELPLDAILPDYRPAITPTLADQLAYAARQPAIIATHIHFTPSQPIAGSPRSSRGLDTRHEDKPGAFSFLTESWTWRTAPGRLSTLAMRQPLSRAHVRLPHLRQPIRDQGV